MQVVDPGVPGTELRLQLRLADGTPLAVDMDEPRLQISPWVLGALALQLALLVGLGGVAYFGSGFALKAFRWSELKGLRGHR